jgi:D-3-phosphoglycerate dehydrogenase
MKVLVAEKIGASGIQLLRDNGFEVDEGAEHLDHVGDYDGLLIRSATTVDADMLGRAANLKAIGRAGVGVDNVDVPAAT